jgi:hypothetical protein
MKYSVYLGIVSITALSSMAFANDNISAVTEDLPPIEKLILHDYHQGEEVQMMESLMGLTEESLLSQKEIMQSLKLFYSLQKSFIANQLDKKTAYQFLQQADQLKELIHQNFLEHLFREEFLEELSTLSQITSEDKVSS